MTGLTLGNTGDSAGTHHLFRTAQLMTDHPSTGYEGDLQLTCVLYDGFYSASNSHY